MYPAIMIVAVLGGLRPGLVATALAVLVTDYFELPPIGHLSIGTPSEFIPLTLFAVMGVFVSVVAEFYRRSQRRIAVFETEEALRAGDVRYHGVFSAMEEGFCIVEMIFDGDGKAVDYRFLEVNEAFEKQTGLQDAAGKSMREMAPGNEPYWAESWAGRCYG